jgi:hypothetical protein
VVIHPSIHPSKDDFWCRLARWATCRSRCASVPVKLIIIIMMMMMMDSSTSSFICSPDYFGHYGLKKSPVPTPFLPSGGKQKGNMSYA